MKATDFLTETFDKPAAWDWGELTSESSWAAFNSGGRTFVVMFGRKPDTNKVVMSFKDAGIEGFEKTGEFKKTSPVQVFATIIEIARSYLKIFSPFALGFYADANDASRVKLYTRLASQFKAPGYELHTLDASEGEGKEKKKKKYKAFVFHKA